MSNPASRPAITVSGKRWWVLSQLDPRDRALVATCLAPLPHPVGTTDLAILVDRVSLLYPGLRYTLAPSEAGPVPVESPRPLVVLRDEPIGPDHGDWAGLALAEAARGLDPAAGPLLRLTSCGGERPALLLVGHRVLGDRAFLAGFAANLLALMGGDEASAAGDGRADVEHEEAWLSGEEGQALLQATRARLLGASLTLDLPTDRPRTDDRSHRVASLDIDFSGSHRQALTALARASGSSAADVACAAYALLLARYSRQAEVLIGETIEPAGTRGRVPGSSNSVVLRIDASAPSSARELVARVREERKAARRSVQLPLEVVIQALDPARDPSRAPIFQVSYTVRSLRGRGLDEPVVGSELDLCFEISVEGDEVRGRMVFSQELFDPETVARLCGHLLTLLARLADDPERPVREISMLTEGEREALLEERAGDRVFGGTPAIHRWVESQAARHPKAVAVRCADSTLTYGELNGRANRFARALRAKGVTRESRVLVCMERSVDLIVVLLGILKAGGAYVPIEPTNPAERIGFVLADASASLAITDKAAGSLLQNGGAEVIWIDGWDAFAGLPEGNLDDVEAGDGDPADPLAYVIYTSGSTGKPKGCLVSHHNVVRLFEATEEWFRFDAQDVWTMFHSVAFDFSVWEIWGALMYGGRLVVVPQPVTRSPEDFVRLCAAEGVTVLNQTPSAFRQFVSAEGRMREAGLALRVVVFGGEALELESLRPWFARHGDQSPRLVNMYGITETTVHVTYRPLSLADLDLGASSVIGRPLPDLYVYLLDEAGLPVPVGVPGEIHVGGAGVARGYLDRPELTAARFVEDPFQPGQRLYRSGDLARWLPSGELDYLGRIDHQVKIRGFRVETGEIEALLRRTGLVHDVAVVPRTTHGETNLVAYVVTEAHASDLRAHLRRQVPEYMVPAVFVRLAAIPMTGNGKVDRAALPPPADDREAAPHLAVPQTDLERTLCRVWCDVLGLSRVGVDESFFDLGGNSLRVVAVAARLRENHGIEVAIAKLFHHTTVRALAAQMAATAGHDDHRAARERGLRARAAHDEPIAIVGMAGRFPGAADIEAFWRNLCEGVESLTFFSPTELDPGIPAADREDPAYVAARPILADATAFDASFFGISPVEAEVIDPQQRVMLEVAWEALENAGYDPAAFPGLVGVFCGEYNNTYYTANVLTRPDVVRRAGAFLAMVGNEKDFIATRIAHRLDLKGPALSLYTACSTSLVATASAFYALRTYQCDMALAGGAAISFPQRQGYLYSEGGMLSADGHCRPFDAAATGTTFGDGAAMVVLRRLSDARAAGDHVYAVIRGAATNNDGGNKMSFSAPTVAGQAQVIVTAQAVADVSPDTIDYVEAHGTATPLGDPIEVEALTQAFRSGTDAVGFCGLGSVKSNVGHLTAAAGVTGLIKTALSLERELVPRSLHYETPNPRIELDRGPFYVVTKNRAWPRGTRPRRAGVSSFGVGGTNAHVVLEEAPPRPPAGASRAAELLLLSARTPDALARMRARLADHLAERPGLSLSDVAYTLAMGRRAFAHRCAVVARDADEAVAALRATPPPPGGVAPRDPRQIVFAFPGQGAQHVGMGRQLYATEPVFRQAIDRCSEIAERTTGSDLRRALFSPADDDDEAAQVLRDTRVAQPALFTVSYALAALLGSWGLRPDLLVGHSVGEFVAACLASVMDLEDAVRLVAERGRLMQSMPGGSMLSVRCAAADVEHRLSGGLCLAAANSPKLCVVAGPDEAIATLARELDSEGIPSSRLHTSHAFHSAMMDEAVPPFAEIVRGVRLAPPLLPIVSTVTGKTLTDEEATDPLYWARHLRATVRFADAVAFAWETPTRVLIDLGPRGTGAQLARQIARDPAGQTVIAALDGKTGVGEWSCVLRAVGAAFSDGLPVDLGAVFSRDGRGRVPLPSYSFERSRHFVEPGESLGAGGPGRPEPADSLVKRQLDLISRQMEILARART